MARVEVLAQPLERMPYDLVSQQQLLYQACSQPAVAYQVPQLSTSYTSYATNQVLIQQQYVQPVLQVAHVTGKHLEVPEPAAVIPAGQRPATVFFAGVTPVADGQRLRLLFSQFGRVLDLNLFRPYNGCCTSKGCGLVVFSQHSAAAAALDALHGRFVWPGARFPMVVEWWDPNKQHKKKRAQPLVHTHISQQYPVHMQQVPQMQQVQHVQQHLPLQQPRQPVLMVQGGMPMLSQDLGMQVVYINQHST